MGIEQITATYRDEERSEMNVQNMAKGMNDVERFGLDFWYTGAGMEKSDDGDYIRYTDYAEVRRLYQAEISAIQQQLAAAREELAFADECVRVMELAIAKIAARRILATGTKSIPDLSAEEANKAAYGALSAIATLQRDRQP